MDKLLRADGSDALPLEGPACATLSVTALCVEAPDEGEPVDCAAVGLFLSLTGFAPAHDCVAVVEDVPAVGLEKLGAALADKTE
jgi:hypothetical protein